MSTNQNQELYDLGRSLAVTVRRRMSHGADRETALKAVAVVTPADEPVVYLVCEPSTRYYRVMTRAEWMPVLIGEVI